MSGRIVFAGRRHTVETLGKQRSAFVALNRVDGLKVEGILEKGGAVVADINIMPPGFSAPKGCIAEFTAECPVGNPIRARYQLMNEVASPFADDLQKEAERINSGEPEI